MRPTDDIRATTAIIRPAKRFLSTFLLLSILISVSSETPLILWSEAGEDSQIVGLKPGAILSRPLRNTHKEGGSDSARNFLSSKYKERARGDVMSRALSFEPLDSQAKVRFGRG